MSTVICEGYLTKSPPEHKINRARWCRRYFKLSSSDGELFLQYFKDSTCNKLKGSINLRECEQVDQGLSFETRSKLKDAHIFDIVTQRRKYFLVTETEADMLRWVQSICTACGFQSEDSLSDIGDVPDGLTQEPVETTLVTAQPAVRTNGDESYIQLDECNTGNDPSSNHQLPPKVNGQVSAVLQAQQQQKKWDTLSSTSSSAPSDTAPSPPESRPVSEIEGGMDIYNVPPTQTSDAPPVPRRPRTMEESIYKVVVPGARDPTSHKFDRQISSAGSRGSFSNSDDTGGNSSYDFVRGSSERNSGMTFEGTESDVMESNYDAPPPRPPPPTTDEIYQVPPVRGSVDHQQENTYDIPPMSPPIESTYDVLPSPLQKTPKQTIPSHLRPSEPLSKSTDDLARSFEEISQNNAHQSFANGDLEHSTYDPVPAMDLNASIGSNNSFSMFRDMGPASDAMEAPPRPAKPSYMCTPTPPPSVDETYSVPPQSNHHLSPQEVRRRLDSMELNSGSTPPQKNSPHPPIMGGQHKWLEQHIPVGYINTKRSSSSIAVRANSQPPGRGYLAMRSNTLAGGRVPSGVPLGFQNGQGASAMGQQQQPGSYMAMQGSSESPKMGLTLGGAITEDCYMPMQSQNEASPDMYTNMNSQVPSAAPAVPRRPPRPSTSSTISISSTTSGDSVPPPVDRRNKPRSTDSSIINPDMIGMEGSFYATGPELPPDFPVQNHRTKSFSRKSSRHRDSPPIPSTPPRPQRSIHSSSSSHLDPSQLIGDPYSVPPSPATSLVDDAYVFTDAPPPTKPRIEFHHFQTRHASIDSAIHPHSPTLPPRSHTVEYLELDHDSDTQGNAAPPPKATSPKDQVEYIHLDLEKTKALQEVTQNREECYRPKNSDSGTIRK